jgi:hypothetical protein
MTVTEDRQVDLSSIKDTLKAEVSRPRMSKLKVGRLVLQARPLVATRQWAKWLAGTGLNKHLARHYMNHARPKVFTGLSDDSDILYQKDLKEFYGLPLKMIGEIGPPDHIWQYYPDGVHLRKLHMCSSEPVDQWISDNRERYEKHQAFRRKRAATQSAQLQRPKQFRENKSFS